MTKQSDIMTKQSDIMTKQSDIMMLASSPRPRRPWPW